MKVLAPHFSSTHERQQTGIAGNIIRPESREKQQARSENRERAEAERKSRVVEGMSQDKVATRGNGTTRKDSASKDKA